MAKSIYTVFQTTKQNKVFQDKVVNPELSVRAGGSEVFPPVIKGLSPSYFDRKTTEN